jgi:outer membrane receptor for ferrienterochelin and colicin
MNRMTLLAASAVLLSLSLPAAAQTNTQSQLRLVVVDETGAGIPSAMVVVTPATGNALTFNTDDRGLAVSPPLPTGAAKIHVEFPGFDPLDEAVTLQRGAVNRTVTLKISGVVEEVVVEDTTATDDRRGNSMSTTLEAAEIAELPDDPDELAEVLQQMAGPGGATFVMNGFRGGRLPNRDEIRQIRFRASSFSADNHEGGGRTQIEIITRPNVRQWDGNGSMNYKSDAMNARNAFSNSETPEQIRTFNFGARGPIVMGKTSLRLGVDGRRNNESDTIVAVNEQGARLGDFVRRPSEQTNFTVGIESAVNNNQTFRTEVRRGENSSSNNGVGGFNLPERGFERSGSSIQVRTPLQGLVGKSRLNEIRLQFFRNENEITSLSSAPSIIVLDAFSKGGAGQASTSSNRTFELADNFDFTIGRKHQMRVGLLLEGGQYKYFDARNAAGTFTFSSLDAYLAGRPTQFTQRIGQVNTSFTQYQLGVFWQDDIRVNNKFSYSLGLRNEAQSHIGDRFNLMPRVGFTWAPFGNRMPIRGGYGMFYDWYESNLYDQTLRVNGISQRDLLILNPGYPDPSSGTLADVQPGGRIQADRNLRMPYEHQISIGVERQLAQNFTLQTTYLMTQGRNQLRSVNVNAPTASGVRPDPTVGTVTQFESTGRSTMHRVSFNGNYRFPAKRIFINGSYTLGQLRNHADSATQLPANSFDPDAEWGPSSQDIRHRVQASLNVPLAFGLRTNLNLNAQSARPYTLTTGRDDNRDGSINDRPFGVGRNSERGEGSVTVNLSVRRAFGLGGTRTNGPGGPGGGPGGPGGPGGRPGGFGGPGGGGGGAPALAQGPGGGRQGGGRGGGGGGDAAFNSRRSMELVISANNLLNHVNYGGFSGNMLSPFFRRPTSALYAREVQVSMQFRF